MTARSPHFECGASTSFATRPWVQLSYYNLFSEFTASDFGGLIAKFFHGF